MTDQEVLVAGRYRLAERIGAGAMGVVWRARDERLGRIVALKQLAGSAANADADGVERIMREGRIAARLHHPNAISVFDVVDHGGTPWLVMEYLPSRSLATVLAEHGPLPPREVAGIGRQLADALADAHAAGILHRDVKPGNVLLGDGGVAKLTDFGISRAAGDVTVTRTGVLSGTPAFLAPEVARGAQPSPASDVFALGSTLYTAIEGHPPFGAGDNPLAVLHQVAGGQVLPPMHAGPMTALLMQLLRSDPAERPTMAQVRDGLAALLSGRHVRRPQAAGLPVPSGGPPSGGPPSGGPPSGGPPSGGPPCGGPPLDGGPLAGGPLPHGGLPPASGPLAGGPLPHTRVDLPPAAAPYDEQPFDPLDPGPYGQPSGSPDGERDHRPALLIAAGVALAVLTGLLVLAATTGPERPAARPAPVEETTAVATTTTPPTTTPPPTTTRVPTAAELQQAVTDYYRLLPDDVDEAWLRLGPSMQAGGFDAYEELWDDVEAVQAFPSKVDPAVMTVRVLVVYRMDDRRPRGEVHDLVLVRSGDALLIDADRLVGSAQVPTTTRKRGRG